MQALGHAHQQVGQQVPPPQNQRQQQPQQPQKQQPMLTRQQMLAEHQHHMLVVQQHNWLATEGKNNQGNIELLAAKPVANNKQQRLPIKALDPPPRVARKRKKKSKDFPRQPLSPYNFVFKERRAIMLGLTVDFSRDTKKKSRTRVRNAKHGVSFADMALIISKEWKLLLDKDKGKYKTLAERDKTRYSNEKDVYFKANPSENPKKTTQEPASASDQP
jgi:hypothetical protein